MEWNVRNDSSMFGEASAHMAYDQYCCRPLAYACCGGSSHVAVVDLTNGIHIKNIPCGEDADPYYIAIGPMQDQAYVADYSRRMILKLDLNRGQVINEVSVMGRPHGVDVSPCGCFVYVVFDDEPVMQVLQTGSMKGIGHMRLPAPSGSVDVTPGGRVAYVTLPSLNQTAAVDLCTLSVTSLLDTGINPGRMAVSLGTPLLLVAGRDSQTITPINTCNIRPGADILLDGHPGGLAFAYGERACLVALQRENEVAIVNIHTRQVVSRISVGNLPGGVATSKCCPLAAVCNQADDTLSILNTDRLSCIATVQIGGSPTGVAVVG